MKGYSVSLSIVTFNNANEICSVLDSIFEYTQGVDMHVFVVDNHSADDTVNVIRQKNYDVTLIENKENIGFGAAHNKALVLSESKYHVFVNPDIIIESPVICGIGDYLELHADIGAVTPKVLNPDGSVQVLPKRDPKFIYLLSRRIDIGVLEKYRWLYEMRDKKLTDVTDIEFSSGCFMFVRTSIAKKVGGFDERFFLYFEDADLTRSIRQISRTVYHPGFCVVHQWNRAGAKSIKYLTIQIVSMIKYIWKWKRQ